MKTKTALLLSTGLVALFALEVHIQAQLFLDFPGGAGITEIDLNENESGQVRDFSIRNGGSSAGNIFGLQFAAQVGNGISGPQITDVKLYSGDSIFASFSGNQVDQGSTPWRKFFGIDDGGSSVSIPASSSTLLARLTFDTTGLFTGSGPWALSFKNVSGLTTGYVLSDLNSTPLAIDNIVNGQINIVPEPGGYGLVMGTLVLGFGVLRRLRHQGQPGHPPL